MLKIGITGVMGSGKSLICQAFETFGIPVYNCDKEAKRLNESDPTIIEGLKEIVGQDIYDTEGHLRKKEMAQRIFSDKAQLQRVNQLIHPIVRKDFESWAQRQKAPIVLCETAILTESGMDTIVDKTIVVTLPQETRIARAMKRDHLTREEVVARMQNQKSDNELTAKANYVLTPDDKHFVLPEIQKIIDFETRQTC